ncbi:MAG: methyltransferase [Gemmataceae bacterium]|nr:methyltransferase [Gemmataceae bacterium]
MPSAYMPLWPAVKDRLGGPVLVLLGSPRTAGDLVEAVGRPDSVCWQIDGYQGDRLQEELVVRGLTARVEVTPDLWDLPAEFGAVVFPSPPSGERELKLDLVDQSFHVLKQRGMLAVLSPVNKDKFYPPLMKKVFGKVALETGKLGTVLWSVRDGERKRRRHEQTFSARVRPKEYVEFLTRPGLFSYGKLDDGTRSLLDVLEVREGERIVDLGCGCGVAGIVAALRAGETSSLTLADSNARAIAVARLNIEKHGLKHAEAIMTNNFQDLPEKKFDLALANPPYFAHGTIAALFAKSAHRLLKRGGRLYLVTRQVEEVAAILEELFEPPLILARRDYAVLVVTRL